MNTRSAIDQWYRRLQTSYDRFLQRLIHILLKEVPTRSRWSGAIALVLGMSASTLLIATLRLVAPVNLSLVYLLVVIWLAIVYGRGLAVLAAFLAFLIYDYCFIPPVFTITVDDAAEYVALIALLITGLVIGQLTAELRRQIHVAIDSQHRTTILYELAQQVADDLDFDQLLATLTQRIIRVFASSGVVNCALYLPDSQGALQPRAMAHVDDLPMAVLPPLDAPDLVALAESARASGILTYGDAHTYFIPLISHRRVVGVLGIAGFTTIASLTTAMSLVETATGTHAEIFAAFCDQIALALERAELHQEAIQAHARRESERLKEALLDSVTHDLRTPIAAIQASVTSLLQPDVSWNAQESRELTEFIAAGAKRLGRLVDNLLAISRLEAGMASPNKAWYPINDVIATALRHLQLAGQIDSHPIQVAVTDDLLEAPMDHLQIERVITNLIENAIKYSPPGSPVQISARITETALEVRVSDQGVGISSEQHEAIFDKFYRLQQTFPWAQVRPPQGSGLGLAICSSIVREHGGRIWVESAPGQGSTFIFTLPLGDTTKPCDKLLPIISEEHPQ
jgi:two-component system, OmpR family, sensor histidine kinase KdpD